MTSVMGGARMEACIPRALNAMKEHQVATKHHGGKEHQYACGNECKGEGGSEQYGVMWPRDTAMKGGRCLMLTGSTWRWQKKERCSSLCGLAEEETEDIVEEEHEEFVNTEEGYELWPIREEEKRGVSIHQQPAESQILLWHLCL